MPEIRFWNIYTVNTALGGEKIRFAWSRLTYSVHEIVHDFGRRQERESRNFARLTGEKHKKKTINISIYNRRTKRETEKRTDEKQLLRFTNDNGVFVQKIHVPADEDSFLVYVPLWSYGVFGSSGKLNIFEKIFPNRSVVVENGIFKRLKIIFIFNRDVVFQKGICKARLLLRSPSEMRDD